MSHHNREDEEVGEEGFPNREIKTESRQDCEGVVGLLPNWEKEREQTHHRHRFMATTWRNMIHV